MGTTYTFYLAKLSTLQNKVVRQPTHFQWQHSNIQPLITRIRKHSTSYYSNLKILKLPDLLTLETAKLVFRHLRK